MEKNSTQIRQFDNLHKGEDCFILCNGPSLNKINLDLLTNKWVIGLNKIYLAYDSTIMRVDYHVAVNNLVIKQSYEHIASLNVPTFLSLRGIKELKIAHLPGNIFPIDTNKHEFDFSDNPYTSLKEGWTVTYVALQIAYWLGFHRVFITGMDHHFEYTGAANFQNFLKGPDKNHFHPNYFENQEWHNPDLKHSEMSYLRAKKYYELNGRQVFDATVGGHCRIFPKIDYAQAVSICSNKKTKDRKSYGVTIKDLVGKHINFNEPPYNEYLKAKIYEHECDVNYNFLREKELAEQLKKNLSSLIKKNIMLEEYRFKELLVELIKRILQKIGL